MYDTFEPAEARRLLRTVAFHYTPIHGSWLNMAEIEIALIGRECLRRRAGDQAKFRRLDPTPQHFRDNPPGPPMSVDTRQSSVYTDGQ